MEAPVSAIEPQPDSSACRAQAPAVRQNWFVGYTKPREERRAVENLRRQGFDCHLPLVQVPRRVRGEVLWELQAMFPRYLFLKPAAESAPLERVRSTFGMTGLVRFAGLPATVADCAVMGLLNLGEVRREDLFQPRGTRPFCRWAACWSGGRLRAIRRRGSGDRAYGISLEAAARYGACGNARGGALRN